MRLILASASPRRAELLRTAGFEFEIVAVSVDETVRDGESPAAYVRRLAADKSFVASGFSRTIDGPPKGGHHIGDDMEGPPKGGRHTSDEAIILGADTTVVVDGEILGKPRDDGDAAAMLRRLSGRRHEVLTGVSLRRAAYEVGRVETSAVYFAPLSTDEIAWYIASGEWRDKAGAYAIQGLASRFIPRIEGSYSNIVGLPVACIHELMAGIPSP
ncbi:MAG: septum formation protein Maf [Acidobacteria bacterium]|nr:MAG: septum formation protein Maf [Acidobacteriota bacterium]